MSERLEALGFKRHVIKGGREVFQPCDAVANLHRYYMSRMPQFRFRTIEECVRHHVKNRFFYKLDISNAYGCVTGEMAHILPIDFGNYSPFFFHKDGGLIQGAPASPYIFELYCQETIDRHIGTYCRTHLLFWSRYMDDILISHPNHRIVQKHKRPLRRILERAGFVVNTDKTQSYDGKLQPFNFIGVKFHNWEVTITDEARKKLRESEPGSYVRLGCQEWLRYVVAMNHWP